VLFLQGGASLQFAMVPMNLLPSSSVADYIDSGSWADKAIDEARRVGQVNVAGSTKAEHYTRLPANRDLELSARPAYVHMTSNNTIEGTQYKELPEVGNAPLVCDASSDIFSRPIDIRRYALIYAGAQKNLGPAGTTVVIARDDMLERAATRKASLSAMLSYAVHAQTRSLYNTPAVFAVYVLGLVMKWLLAAVGLAAIARLNERKAATLYSEIDRTGFYRGTAEEHDRS